MRYLAITLVALLGLVIIQPPHRSKELRLAAAYLVLCAVFVTIGLLLGVLGIELSGFAPRLIFPLGLLSAALLLTRFSGNQPFLVRQPSAPISIWLTPLLFLVVTGAVLLRQPSVGMRWLLDTWDATSNPGVVSTTRVLPSLDFYPNLITGWEGYPRGTHFIAASVANIFGDGATSFPVATLKSLFSMTWLIYALIILFVGLLANRTGMTLGFSNKWNQIMAVGAQAFLMTPFAITHLLMLHSLAFLGAILSCLIVTLIVLERTEVSPAFHSGELILSIASGYVLVGSSYPILLPVIVATILLVLRSLVEQNRRDNGKIYLSLHVFVGFIMASVVTSMLITMQDRVNPSGIYKAGGQLYPIDARWLILEFFLVLFLCLYCLRRRGFLSSITPIFILGAAVAVPLMMWILAGSRDRSFGVNYYPKKAEYASAILCLPFALVGFAGLCRALRFHRIIGRKIGITLTTLAPVFMLVQLWRGPIQTFWGTRETDAIASALIDAALTEAKIPGRSLMIDDRQALLSWNATLLSNYIDKSFWQTPGGQTANIILIQRFVSRSDTESILDMCSFLGTNAYGAGRIVELPQGINRYCPPN